MGFRPLREGCGGMGYGRIDKGERVWVLGVEN